MILAGDIGGTNTRLLLFEVAVGGEEFKTDLKTGRQCVQHNIIDYSHSN